MTEEKPEVIKRLFRRARAEKRSIFHILREVMDIGISRLEQFEEQEEWMEMNGKRYDDKLPF